jgi:hypothetical protein
MHRLCVYHFSVFTNPPLFASPQFIDQPIQLFTRQPLPFPNISHQRGFHSDHFKQAFFELRCSLLECFHAARFD